MFDRKAQQIEAAKKAREAREAAAKRAYEEEKRKAEVQRLVQEEMEAQQKD